MKTKRLFTRSTIVFTGLMIAVLLIAGGCEKEKEDSEIEKVITVEGGTLHTGAIPNGNDSGPSIGTFSGNQYVLPGGSNAITLQSDQEASAAMVGIQGISGYYEVPVMTTQSGSSVTIYIFVDPEIDMQSFSIILALRQGNTTGIHQELPVTLVSAGTGKLQVTLSWDLEVDLDLYLVEPNGTTIYYGSGESANGGLLDIDSNAACNIDGIKNENITYGDESVVETGEYIVRVNLWANCDITDQINYIASAKLNGNVISPSFGTNPMFGNYPAGSDSQGGGINAGQEVLKFVVNNTAVADATTYARFNFPTESLKSTK